MAWQSADAYILRAHPKSLLKAQMKIPTEPIGSIRRPLELIEAITKAGDHADPELGPPYEAAIRDAIEKFKATGSRERVLKTLRQYPKPNGRAFVGVVSPIDLLVDAPEEVRDRVLEAAKYIPIEQLGTTDDCGFSPFSDDTSTTRETAFAEIRARVKATGLAEGIVGNG
jgi:methionine synthase II (cobalamin-independent)